MNLFLLPIHILKFWYLEAPVNLITYFIHLDKTFFHLFSIPLMLRTFFKPWKNEYREGFVGFSIFMGMVFKTGIIFAGLFIFTFILISEVIAFFVFLGLPFLAFYIAFFKII